MPIHNDHDVLEAIRQSIHRLSGETADFDPLLKMIGDSRFVLIGEASHGTHEFYRLRAQITKRLIAEKGFIAVAVEADWPDAYRVNQFVRFEGEDEDAIDALAGFQRFPAWMWRNADVLDFVGWLRNYNEHRHSKRPLASMGWTSTACMPPCGQSWISWTKSILKLRVARGIAMPASRILAKTPKLMDMPPALV